MHRRDRATVPAGFTVALALAVAVATWIIRPWEAAQVGFDSAASVIHFQRLTAGLTLEAFVTTTPKPLLTVLYGVLHAVGGWPLISWASIGAFGLLAAAAATLAWRIAGAAAAAFVAVALAGSGILLVETAYAYSVPLAGLLWAGAGLAVTCRPPRYGLAGMALLLAALARIETLIVIGLVAGILTIAEVVHRARPGTPGLPRGAWRLAIGLAAAPVMLLHDWLLTGDAWFWLTVSARYTEAAAQTGTIQGPVEILDWIARRYAADPALAALLLVGAASLVARRQWAIGVGLLAIGPGIAAFLVALAARGTYVSSRYIAPVDLAVLFAAGLGAGALASVVARWLAPRVAATPSSRARLVARVAAIALVAVAAVVLTRPWGPRDLGAVRRIANERALHANAGLVGPAIGAALDAIAGSRDRPTPGAGVNNPSGRTPLLLVPPLLRPRLALELGMPLDRVAGLNAAAVRDRAATLLPGRIIYHDLHGGQDDDAFAYLRIEVPTVLGDVLLVPLVADAATGAWVLRVEPSGGS